MHWVYAMVTTVMTCFVQTFKFNFNIFSCYITWCMGEPRESRTKESLLSKSASGPLKRGARHLTTDI